MGETEEWEFRESRFRKACGRLHRFRQMAGWITFKDGRVHVSLEQFERMAVRTEQTGQVEQLLKAAEALVGRPQPDEYEELFRDLVKDLRAALGPSGSEGAE